MQEEVLETDLNSFDGCHHMQALDDRGVDGGSHAIGQVAVSAIHVAMENGAGRSRDDTVGLIWNDAAVQAPGVLCDLIDFVGPSVNEFDYFSSTFLVDFECEGAIREEGPFVFFFFTIKCAVLGIGKFNTQFSRAPSFNCSHYVDQPG